MVRDKRQKRDLHALDSDGMVVCNPRDKEAAPSGRNGRDRDGQPRRRNLPQVLIPALPERQLPGGT
jgi:hypothetical protein